MAPRSILIFTAAFWRQLSSMRLASDFTGSIHHSFFGRTFGFFHNPTRTAETLKKRKRLILMPLLFALSFAHGQLPMPLADGVWLVDWGTSDCLNWGLNSPGLHYQVNGDTVIGSVMYKRIHRSGVCDDCCPAVNEPYNGYLGGLRQDSVRVYIVPAGNTIEEVYADLSLHIGDTLFGYLPNMITSTCSHPWVSDVDSVMLNDGLYHKRIKFNCPSFPATEFIQGVGYSTGLFEVFVWNMEITATLLCCMMQGSYLYDTGQCQFDVIPEVSIDYWVPTVQYLSTGWQVQLNSIQRGGSNLQVTLFNTIGQVIMTKVVPCEAHSFLLQFREGAPQLMYLQIAGNDHQGNQYSATLKLFNP